MRISDWSSDLGSSDLVDAGTVAGLAVGIDGAAVPDCLQRLDAGDHDVASRGAVEGGDEANAAGVMLLSRVVEAVARELGGIALPGGDEVVARCRAGAKGSLFRHLPFLPLPASSSAPAAVAVLAWTIGRPSGWVR